MTETAVLRIGKVGTLEVHMSMCVCVCLYFQIYPVMKIYIIKNYVGKEHSI